MCMAAKRRRTFPKPLLTLFRRKRTLSSHYFGIQKIRQRKDEYLRLEQKESLITLKYRLQQQKANLRLIPTLRKIYKSLQISLNYPFLRNKFV